MNTGKTLFAQLMDFLPWSTFDRIVARYNGNRAVRTLPCTAQYQVMAFAQRLRLEASLYTLLQVFSVTAFEKMPIQSAILATPNRFEDAADRNQLELFAF
jgi:hypothetical protein